ncbi:OLC1v1029254C1 [Oldenlandia corymbosa var. corymbosa]|uniref:OLC1v1029254C1 n=1 Tax=Oldenlandia corymbosa var. corymbosa TaxID=529605 RepID=A0AAV1CEC6_OLDCO|nr:OLC1v1029254C1 [Oldenlandia corymbosa var. corymbosa]
MSSQKNPFSLFLPFLKKERFHFSHTVTHQRTKKMVEVVVGLGSGTQSSCRILLLLLFAFLFFSSSSFSISVSDGNWVDNDDASILLAFKSSSDSANSLNSWSNSTTSSFCSAWLGVTCNPTTLRVTKLALDNLNLTGSAQILSRLSHLRHLSLHHNHLSVTPNFTTTWPNLKHLYLSHNHFTGEFPPGISNLRNLRRLDLSYNDFSGEIPVAELSRLAHLLTLRLESNWFNGSLGSGNSSLKSLLDFNVSDNGLSGRIPIWLSKFPASSFAGNSHLCGKPLLSDCSLKPEIPNPNAGRGPLPIGVTDVKKKKGSKNITLLMIILIDAIGLTLILSVIACCCYYKRRHSRKNREAKKKPTTGTTTGRAYSTPIGTTRAHAGGEMVCFEGCKGFTKVDELLKASAEMLGKGNVGTTYRVALDQGEVVVVKRVREKVWRIKDVDGFLNEIGKLRHPNVVSLRAYYSSKEELLLVYDYLQNGSLHNLLHGNRGPGRTPLDWPARLKIALGSAGGLAFLHGYRTKSKLYHGHFTSSNVIIDDQGNPCISNIGLHQLLQVQSSTNNAYKAPELLPANHAAGSKYSQKCDVYSFGVVLLEILTGKMATSEGETSLVKWVQRVAREEWTWDVFDFELVRHKEMEEEMMALLEVAILCLASSPKDRPKMIAVQKMIQDITTKRGEGIRPFSL